MKIAVIGGGIAGTAAAWAARRAGADVTAIFDRPGASSLYAGALDVLPWEEGAVDAPLEPDVLAFATALEAWSVGTKSVRVATADGVLRPARGRDSSILDVAPLAGKRVGVVATRVDGWDAAALARALDGSSWAKRTRTRFDAVAVPGVVEGAEGRATAYDIAALHDRPERLARLAESLRRAASAADAWLFGAWLGTAPGGGEALSLLVGKPCGETTSSPGGPAGARFDASRDALLSSSGVLLRRERVDALEPRGSRLLVIGGLGGLTANDAGFDTIVLATGGLVGGGIVLSDEGDGIGNAVFRSGVHTPVELGLAGRPLERATPAGAIDVATLGMGVLERIGILADGSLARGARIVLVAGDCVADSPRTALGAARSGIAAARRAALVDPAAQLRPESGIEGRR